MFVTDFEYDGKLLSGMGYMICSFDGGFNESVSNGSIITLNTTPFQNGMRHELTSSTYQECLTATFCICKNPCIFDDDEISVEEIRILMRWLNRRQFLKFRFLEDDYVNFVFYATFPTINRVESGGKCIGLELTMQTDRPFGLQRSIVRVFESNTNNWSFFVGCASDENAYLNVILEVTMKAGGRLEIANKTTGEISVIDNCSVGEVIKMDYPLIESDMALHDIPNDFNWNWFRMRAGMNKERNDVEVNLPCKIKMTYCPIVKVGLL